MVPALPFPVAKPLPVVASDEAAPEPAESVVPWPESAQLDTSITKIPSGFVGVVRSTISQPGRDCTPIFANTHEGGLEAKLVPRGCAGIWNVSLPPGDYYLNRDAFDVTLVDTRVQTLEFKGGYTRRYIDLKVDQKGDFTQSERVEQIRVDPNVANDAAIGLKVEGWEVAQELRVVLLSLIHI